MGNKPIGNRQWAIGKRETVPPYAGANVKVKLDSSLFNRESSVASYIFLTTHD
jgi:hypothetical protein